MAEYPNDQSKPPIQMTQWQQQQQQQHNYEQNMLRHQQQQHIAMIGHSNSNSLIMQQQQRVSPHQMHQIQQQQLQNSTNPQQIRHSPALMQQLQSPYSHQPSHQQQQPHIRQMNSISQQQQYSQQPQNQMQQIHQPRRISPPITQQQYSNQPMQHQQTYARSGISVYGNNNSNPGNASYNSQPRSQGPSPLQQQLQSGPQINRGGGNPQNSIMQQQPQRVYLGMPQQNSTSNQNSRPQIQQQIQHQGQQYIVTTQYQQQSQPQQIVVVAPSSIDSNSLLQQQQQSGQQINRVGGNTQNSIMQQQQQPQMVYLGMPQQNSTSTQNARPQIQQQIQHQGQQYIVTTQYQQQQQSQPQQIVVVAPSSIDPNSLLQQQQQSQQIQMQQMQQTSNIQRAPPKAKTPPKFIAGIPPNGLQNLPSGYPKNGNLNKSATKNMPTTLNQLNSLKESTPSTSRLVPLNSLPITSSDDPLHKAELFSAEALDNLIKSVDDNEVLEEGVEKVMMRIVEELTDNIVKGSVALCKHRQSRLLEKKDVQFLLSKQLNMAMPPLPDGRNPLAPQPGSEARFNGPAAKRAAMAPHIQRLNTIEQYSRKM